MGQDIIDKFRSSLELYEALIDVEEKIFSALKLRDFETFEALDAEEGALFSKLGASLEGIAREVGRACDAMRIKEKKLTALLEFLNGKEKQEIGDCLKAAQQYERKLKNNKAMNLCLGEALMRCNQTVIDAWVHTGSRDGGEKRLNAFLSKKF